VGLAHLRPDGFNNLISWAVAYTHTYFTALECIEMSLHPYDEAYKKAVTWKALITKADFISPFASREKAPWRL
jgi:hypothetical protein